MYPFGIVVKGSGAILRKGDLTVDAQAEVIGVVVVFDYRIVEEMPALVFLDQPQ